MFAGAVHNFGTEWLNPLVSVVFAIAIFFLGYKGLFQKSIFSNSDVSEISEPISVKTLKPINIDIVLSDNLQNYMDTYKPHHDSELTTLS